jgi:LysR family transcriptional regulator, nitrogen assimilation regulatory protein
MDLKHIRAFMATCEEGSINRAAQRLGSAQPSVSVLIRDLEAELGITLFERRARGTEHTEEAKTLYVHLQRVLAELDAAYMNVSGRLKHAVGPLHVGLGPTVTRGILPDVLPDYVNEYPQVDVRITEAFSGKLMEWTLAGDLDFAVIAVAPQDRRVIVRRMAVEPVVMISGPASHRPHLKPNKLQNEDKLKVVLPWSQYSIRSMLDLFVSSGQIPVERAVEIDSLSAMLDFVESSDWVTFLPMSTISRDLTGTRLTVQPLAEPRMTTEFYLVHLARKALSAAALAFAQQIEVGFGRSQERWEQAMNARANRPAVKQRP